MLRKPRQSSEETALINVLPEEAFLNEHIPGSINIPIGAEEDFVQRVESVVPSKSYHIIVYCSGPSCSASEKAAKELDKAGFTSVMRFAGGMKEWKEADEPIKPGQ